MSGILAMKQYQPSDKVTAMFDLALESHFANMKVRVVAGEMGWEVLAELLH